LVISGAALAGYGLLWQGLAPRASHSRTAERGTVTSLDFADVADEVRGQPMRHLLGNRSLLLLTASYTALGYLQYVFFYWVSYYFESVLQRSTDDSRWASFVITMSMAVGMAAGGRISDNVCLHCGNRWGRRFVAFTGMGMCALFAWLGVRSTDPTQVTVLFSLSLAALGMCEGIFWTTATEIGGQQGGLTAAFLNTGGNAMGAFAPTITPWLAKQFGWEAAIGVACAICALGGVLWLGIAPTTSVGTAE
jgi:MFS family permease